MLALMPRVARIVMSGNEHHGTRRAGIARQHLEQARGAAELATAYAVACHVRQGGVVAEGRNRWLSLVSQANEEEGRTQ